MSVAEALRSVATLAELGPSGSPLEREWAQLHERCAADPFLHPGVVRAWAGAFGSAPLTLATARRDGELVGALPLQRDGRRLTGAGNWHTVRSGLLALDDEAAAALAAVPFDGRVRGVTIELLDGDSAAMLRRAAADAGWRTLEQPMIRSPYVEIAGSWEDYLAALPRKRRAERGRLQRKLERDGGGALSFERATSGADAERLFAELLELEAQGWKAAQGTAIALATDTSAYYRELIRWAGEQGWLRLDAARIGDRAVAVSLTLEAYGVLYGIKLGADPVLRAASPPLVLMDELVRRCFEAGVRRFEMLGSDAPYKQRWCDRAHERVQVRAFAPSLRGRLDHAELVWARPLARRLRGAGSERVARLRERRGGPADGGAR